jgi:hypothetical protein
MGLPMPSNDVARRLGDAEPADDSLGALASSAIAVSGRLRSDRSALPLPPRHAARQVEGSREAYRTQKDHCHRRLDGAVAYADHITRTRPERVQPVGQLGPQVDDRELGKGNLEVALSIIAVSLLVVIVGLPLVLPLFAGKLMSAGPFFIFRRILLVIVIPLVLGDLTQVPLSSLYSKLVVRLARRVTPAGGKAAAPA